MMDTGTRVLPWLRHAVLGVFVAALLAGILQPIYTDEIGWRLQERAAFDGFDKLFTEICGSNTVVRPPFWMMPARYYSALFNSLFADPLYVRISGILYALVLTGMILTLIRRIGGSTGQQATLATLAFGFLCFGAMPILLVWSRPEQPIVLALTGAMLIALRDWNKDDPDGPGPDTSVRTAWLRSLAVLLLASLALSYHVKALFTMPLMLGCLYFASRGRAALMPRLVAGAAVIAITAWGAHYWVNRLACPDAPAVRAMFISNNTGAALVGATSWSQISPLIARAFDNLSLFQYLGMPTPRSDPISSWLPMYQVSLTTSFLWFLVLIVLWGIAVSFSAFCLAGTARRAWRERRPDARVTLAVLLIAACLGWSATQGYRNPYEAIFIVPMTLLAVILALSTREEGTPFAKAIALLGASTAVLGIISVALMAAIYGPVMVRSTGERGYLKDQPHSISAFGYAGLRRDMLAAARKCAIADPDTNHALAIDDVTYFAFMKSRMPEHANGLFPVLPPQDSIAYLKSVRSDGIVASCHVLPPDIRARARREGQFCCVAPPNW